MPNPVRYRPPRPAEAGYLLPLASGAALLLLLSGLSLQAAVLHQRELAAEAFRELQGEDVLASAAQRLAQQLDGPYRSLLSQPLAAWPAAERAALQQGQEAGQELRLLAWEPSGSAALLRLALLRRDGSGLGQQRTFVLELAGGERLRRLREVGP
ncbi:MAG: hypothetical protein R6W06_00900 [Prochlorococcaceae cyanobacterium]